MSYRYPGRQWKSRVAALGGANMEGPGDTFVPVIPKRPPPAAWTYPSDTLNLSVGVPMTPLVATVVSGTVDYWEVRNRTDYPSMLPEGIALDALTGTISGTPIGTFPSKGYYIVGISKGGPFFVPLTVSVS